MSDSPAAVARLRATIEYDGTSFHGSQLQPEVRTVQSELEAALSRLFDRPTRIDLSGRTDTGVHATAQEIAFEAPASWTVDEVKRALTATLPDDIGVRSVCEASADFHPRFNAEARRYLYVVAEGRRKRPFLRDRCWSIDRPIDREALVDLAAKLPGERSFERFAKAGQPERGTRCRIERAEWIVAPGAYLLFEIVADRFLHHMVRYLVGTTVEIATDRRPAADFDHLLADGEASRPVYPAPPGGLYLTGVRYEGEWNAEPELPWLAGLRA